MTTVCVGGVHIPLSLFSTNLILIGIFSVNASVPYIESLAHHDVFFFIARTITSEGGNHTHINKYPLCMTI